MTPAGTSTKPDVQNKWNGNRHTPTPTKYLDNSGPTKYVQTCTNTVLQTVKGLDTTAVLRNTYKPVLILFYRQLKDSIPATKRMYLWRNYPRKSFTSVPSNYPRNIPVQRRASCSASEIDSTGSHTVASVYCCARKRTPLLELSIFSRTITHGKAIENYSLSYSMFVKPPALILR